MELEVSYKLKGQYILPHNCRKPKDYEGEQVEEILSLILHKFEENKWVWKDIKEKVSLLNQLETQMGHMLSSIYHKQKEGCLVTL